MRLPGEKTWSSGTCTDTAGPRSYRVQVGQAVYRRNRRQLIKTGESNDVPEPIIPVKLAEASPEAEITVPPGECPPSEVHAGPRRSQRQVKPPYWLKDFVTPRCFGFFFFLVFLLTFLRKKGRCDKLCDFFYNLLL